MPMIDVMLPKTITLNKEELAYILCSSFSGAMKLSQADADKYYSDNIGIYTDVAEKIIDSDDKPRIIIA